MRKFDSSDRKKAIELFEKQYPDFKKNAIHDPISKKDAFQIITKGLVQRLGDEPPTVNRGGRPYDAYRCLLADFELRWASLAEQEEKLF